MSWRSVNQQDFTRLRLSDNPQKYFILIYILTPSGIYWIARRNVTFLNPYKTWDETIPSAVISTTSPTFSFDPNSRQTGEILFRSSEIKMRQYFVLGIEGLTIADHARAFSSTSAPLNCAVKADGCTSSNVSDVLNFYRKCSPVHCGTLWLHFRTFILGVLRQFYNKGAAQMNQKVCWP